MNMSGPKASALVRLALVALMAALAHAQIGKAPEALALVRANVLDVRTGRVTANQTVLLRDGKIESVSSSPAPAGIKTLDLAGQTLIPGLVDAHTHIANFAAAKRALESGVTTVRSSGVSYFVDVSLRDLAKSGALAGPDFLASGYHVRDRLAEEAFYSDPALADLLGGGQGHSRHSSCGAHEPRSWRRLDQDQRHRTRGNARDRSAEADVERGGDAGHRRGSGPERRSRPGSCPWRGRCLGRGQGRSRFDRARHVPHRRSPRPHETEGRRLRAHVFDTHRSGRTGRRVRPSRPHPARPGHVAAAGRCGPAGLQERPSHRHRRRHELWPQQCHAHIP